MQNSPIITKMQVIPVAGYDGMLMTLSGAHAPCFTRNLVVLTDNAGHTGVGEIHGGDYTCDCLNAVRPLVEGQPVARYREVLQKIHRIAKHADGDDGEGIQTLDISKLKFVVKSEWAIECAMLDLMGQFLGVPMCTLLGEGQQRKEVEMLGYMFYVSDKNKVPAGEMQYLDESDSPDPWFRLRRQEMLTPERLAVQSEPETIGRLIELYRETVNDSLGRLHDRCDKFSRGLRYVVWTVGLAFLAYIFQILLKLLP